MKSYTKNGFLYFQYCGIGGKLGIRIVSKNTPEEVVVFNNSNDRNNYRESLLKQLGYYGIPIYQVTNTATYVNMTNVTSINRTRNNIFLKFENKEVLVLVYPNVDAAVAAVSELEEAIHDDSDAPAEDIEVIKEELTELTGEVDTVKQSVTSLDAKTTKNINDLNTALSADIEGLRTTTQQSFDNVSSDIDALNSYANTLDSTKADKSDTYTKQEVDQKVVKVYRAKGSVQTYADLPATGQVEGDVYNIKSADKSHDIKAGDNVVWTSEGWDNLRGIVDLSDYLLKSDAQATYATINSLDNHTSNTSNPHNVTASQVGLGNVDNTSDLNKPISTATQGALDTIDGKVDTHIENTSNPHNVTKAQVGLGNVDNTSDMSKPISTATQTALDELSSDMSNFRDSLEHTRDDVDSIRSSVGTLNGSVSALQESYTQLQNDKADVERVVEKSDSLNIVYGTDSQGEQTTYDVGSFGALDDVQINGTSIVSNKVANIAVDQTYSSSSTNPQSGSAIAGAGFLTNKGTLSYNLAIGEDATAENAYSIALGAFSNATAQSAIQLGMGTNSTAESLQVWKYKLLDLADGLIPADRISNNFFSSNNVVAGDGISISTHSPQIGQHTISIDNTIARTSALSSYLTTSDAATTYATKQELSQIPQFDIQVVNSLPVSDISDTTVYLLRNEEQSGSNLYDEYIHVNNTWEKLGTASVDLTDYLQNSSNNSNSLGILSKRIGEYGFCVAIGKDAEVTASTAIAIGSYAKATASRAIQLGYGTNSEANSFYVATNYNANWKMLGSDGLIPDERLSSNIARTSDIPSPVTVDQTYNASSANAQSGVAINNAGFLKNNAFDSSSLAIGPLASDAMTSEGCVAVGYNSQATRLESIAIGKNAQATSNGSIQIGRGTNNEPASLYIGLGNSSFNSYMNYKLLGSDGLIPNNRLPVMTGADGTNAGTKGAVPAPTATDNDKFLRGDGTWAEAGSNVVIDTAITSSSTNTNAAGSKAVWDLVAALETRVAALEAQLDGVETQLSQI